MARLFQQVVPRHAACRELSRPPPTYEAEYMRGQRCTTRRSSWLRPAGRAAASGAHASGAA